MLLPMTRANNPLTDLQITRFHPHAELFTVRVWREDLGGGRVEWRGKVQCVATGEARYFNAWQSLAEFLIEKSKPTI